jgi:hypothetical protein
VQNTVNSFTTTSTILTTGKPTARRWCTAFTKLSTSTARSTPQTSKTKNNPKLFSNGSLAGVPATALASTATPTFFDDLSNAIWRVIALAAIPALIITASCEQHTAELGWAAAQAQKQQANQQAHQTSQVSHASTRPNRAAYTPHTPEGFGAALSHGGPHAPQKQD